LGAPVALVGTEDHVELWSIRKELPTSPFQQTNRAGWREQFIQQMPPLSPGRIAAAKGGDASLPFVDSSFALWAEDVTECTLVALLENLLSRSLKKLSTEKRNDPSARQAVISLVFRLFAGRVLEDKDVIPAASDPWQLLAAVQERFSTDSDPDIFQTLEQKADIAAGIYEVLRNRFAFASLTTSMLGHAYENALVTSSLRKELGIYYTPRTVTEYILAHLPIESIPQEDRYLWDPCCGSGSFLLAGFERLSRLLPESWSPSQVHQYLQERLLGSDVDPIAREIASLSLVLTDIHNRDGWKVWLGDARQTSAEIIGRRPSIIVTNPPFKEIKSHGQRHELSAEILEHLLGLAAPDALLGVVLTQSVLESGTGKSLRKAILEGFDLLEIDILPGGVFYSQADSVVLMLRKRQEQEGQDRRASVAVREVRSRDLVRFNQSAVFTRTYSSNPEKWAKHPDFHFTVSPLMGLWEKLATAHTPLGKVASVTNGLQVKKGDQTSVSTTKRTHADGPDVPFVGRLDVMRPYALLTGMSGQPSTWLHYGDHLRRMGGGHDIFMKAKVLVNATRNSGSAWRLLAAPAPAGLYFADRFHGICPVAPDVSREQICAVLNSPVANAWFDAHCRSRKVVIRVLNQLPFPKFDPASADALRETVRQLGKAVVANWRRGKEGLFYNEMGETGDTASLLAEIDRLVYDAYGLDQYERNQIGKLMSGEKRPG